MATVERDSARLACCRRSFAGRAQAQGLEGPSRLCRPPGVNVLSDVPSIRGDGATEAD